MNEASLSRTLCQRLRRELPGAVVFKHNDLSTAGVPDISVTWGGITVWLEVKRGERITGRGVQRETMRRLMQVGRAYYVHFSPWFTWVGYISLELDEHLECVRSAKRHDYALVVEWVRSVIEENQR